MNARLPRHDQDSATSVAAQSVRREEHEAYARDAGLVEPTQLAEFVSLPDVARNPSTTLQCIAEKFLKQHLVIALIAFMSRT